MVDVVLKFNSKSSGLGVKEACKIAERNKLQKEGNYYIVKFTELTKDLKKLLDLIGNLKYTTLLLDGTEVDLKKVKNILFCRDEKLCRGICRHIRIGWSPLDRLINIFSDPRMGKVFLVRELSDFIEKISDNEFKIERDFIKNYINDEYSLENQYCNKYDIEKIQKTINKLPEKFSISRTISMATLRPLMKTQRKVRERRIYKSSDYVRHFNIAKIYGTVIEHSMRKILSEFYPESNVKIQDIDPEKLLLNLVPEKEISNFYTSLAEYEKNKDKKIEYLKNAIKFSDDDILFEKYFDLGETYKEYNQYDDALNLYNEYLKKYEDNFLILEGLIEIEVAKKNSKRVIELIERHLESTGEKFEFLREIIDFEPILENPEFKHFLKKIEGSET
ncbi:MAG: tetratricopeptide repeat protein [Candidatus Hodarchaeota archaeon]